MIILLWRCVAIFLMAVYFTSTESLATNTTQPKPDWCENMFFCHRSDFCLPMHSKCDGTAQCFNGEDEEDCPDCSASNAEELNKFYCPDEDQCIPLDFKCDKTEDCQNGQDEEDCPEGCREGLWACGDGQCIDATWRCDSQPDCLNEKDEESCEATCGANQFSCMAMGNYSQECVSAHWRCDGEKDCAGGQDELDCHIASCPSDRFNCSGESKCMPNSWRCDGDEDCSSGEDENNCPKTTTAATNNRQCTNLEFKCASGSMPCIIGAWECDGASDCTDGSDEADCPPEGDSCAESEFKCESDGNCIPNFLTCSGANECQDGSDEKLAKCQKNESVHHHCDLAKGEFACTTAFNSPCVPLNKVCDGVKDCISNRDEDRSDNGVCAEVYDENPCDPSNNRCGDDIHIICTNIFQDVSADKNRTLGAVCSCPSGYRQDHNKCYEIDECDNVETPVCDQLCVNLVGSYKCECNVGYNLEEDGRSCKVSEGVHPKLLFTNRYEIRWLHMHNKDRYVPLVDSSAAVALDFDFNAKEVFYSDIEEKKLYKFKIPQSDAEEEPIPIDLKVPGIQIPDGLAYDWIYKHLYWTDTAANTINMACVDDHKEDRMATILYQNARPGCVNDTTPGTGTDVCIDEPRALVVHPRKGWAFWSDWGSRPHIALAALDGSHMEMIAYNQNSETQYLMWPNGLTLDISNENERLYWIDAQLHGLFSCTVNRCSKDMSVLFYSKDMIKHPFSITVFENMLYWTDWTHKHIVSANKYTGGNITTVLTHLDQPMDLKVFHPMSQQNSTNHCKRPNGEPVCHQICVPKPWVRPSPDDNFSPTAGPRFTCLCSDGFTLNSDNKTCSAIPPTTVVPEVKAVAAPPKAKKVVASAEPSGLSVGTIAAIASSIVLLVAIATGLAIFLIMRRVRRNKSKNMNFDNPIYKRTTEDKLELPRHEYQPSQSDPSAVPLTMSESSPGSSSPDFDV